MSDNGRMLDQIERSIGDDPHCHACGAHTTIEADDHGLWLTCSAAAAPTGVLDRIGAVMLPHTRRLVIDFSDMAA